MLSDDQYLWNLGLTAIVAGIFLLPVYFFSARAIILCVIPGLMSYFFDRTEGVILKYSEREAKGSDDLGVDLSFWHPAPAYKYEVDGKKYTSNIFSFYIYYHWTREGKRLEDKLSKKGMTIEQYFHPGKIVDVYYCSLWPRFAVLYRGVQVMDWIQFFALIGLAVLMSWIFAQTGFAENFRGLDRILRIISK
jgi:hypothetical protein